MLLDQDHSHLRDISVATLDRMVCTLSANSELLVALGDVGDVKVAFASPDGCGPALSKGLVSPALNCTRCVTIRTFPQLDGIICILFRHADAVCDERCSEFVRSHPIEDTEVDGFGCCSLVICDLLHWHLEH